MNIGKHCPKDHPNVPIGRIGVLLVNLGSPAAPDKKSVKKYLLEFLSDPRVIEIPRVIWQIILRGIILNVRPAKSARAYQKVWREDGSPLVAITRAQAVSLQQRLGADVMVDFAMRYGAPSIQERLEMMRAKGCERILIAPLYPQYCAATTATVFDKVAEIMRTMRWQPALRTLPPYYDDAAYIGALAADIARQLDALDYTPEALVLSFHGMPARTLELGDPYHCHCQKTARLVGEALGRPELRIVTAFQSRFGRAQWLTPATDATLIAQAEAGIKNLVVAMPGFSADCLETLEEIAIEGKKSFVDAGGENYTALACLNDSAAGMGMLEHIIRRELSGWI